MPARGESRQAEPDTDRALGEGDPTPLPEVDQDATEPAPPVYDDRGNVRPHGTPGAVPMTFEERVAIAKRIAAEKPAPAPAADGTATPPKANPKQKQTTRKGTR